MPDDAVGPAAGLSLDGLYCSHAGVMKRIKPTLSSNKAF